MRIIIDEELRDFITEDWIRTVLDVVDPTMLIGLTVKIIEPSKDDKYQGGFDSSGFDWDDVKLVEELARRTRMGSYIGEKTVEVYMRSGAWVYHSARKIFVMILYHEIYHANDPNVNEEWAPSLVESPYWDHPREVRARAYAHKTYHGLKNKRKVMMVK